MKYALINLIHVYKFFSRFRKTHCQCRSGNRPCSSVAIRYARRFGTWASLPVVRNFISVCGEDPTQGPSRRGPTQDPDN